MPRDPLYIFAVLCLLIVASEWLARRKGFRHLGSALIVILLGALVANLGVIPAGSPPDAPVPVYDAIFAYVAPLALFWLLLHVNLRSLLSVGLPIIALFLAGSAGTLLGAVAAMRLVNLGEVIGPFAGPVAGMFTGTYTGGGINFNAIALHYGVVREGALFAGATVVDNIVTTIWIVATLAVPRLFAAAWQRRARAAARETAAPIVNLEAERETLDPLKLAVVLALGAAALWVSMLAASAFAAAGVPVPMILIITTLALVLAQVPAASSLPGPRVLGMWAVYLFLAVVGVFCDVRAMGGLGLLGVALLAFATLTVAIHGLVIFGAAWIFRMDLAAAAVASQANVGGSTSALALAKSLGREDLLLPGILLGALGNALGTFLGFAAAALA
ncbi:MAG TPA: DUF819 family protein [Vicinamibacterales bacterium]|nr:DUF819 family protein [Vicinamibacterales bacterium]